jgi:hypothetical protein
MTSELLDPSTWQVDEEEAKAVKARFDNACYLLYNDRYIDGWREYDECQSVRIPAFRLEGCPKWTGEDLNGRTILLIHEQGYGDTLQLIRYVPVLKEMGARIALVCPPAMASIQKMVPGLDHVCRTAHLEQVTSKYLHVDVDVPVTDFYCPMAALPRAMRTTVATIPRAFPYLVCPRDVETGARALFDPNKINVGIAWQGQRWHANDNARSIPLAAFEPLAAVPNVELISLQVGYGAEQLDECSFKVRRFDAEFADYGETAAIVSALDLVIACDTSIAHLAAGMAKPTWVALSTVPEWRWRPAELGSHWYPAAKVFRQWDEGDWNRVFERMAVHLAREILRT